MNTPLRRIPGVGKNMAAHLESLGIRWVEDLRGQDPQELYEPGLQTAWLSGPLCAVCLPLCRVFCPNAGPGSGKVQMVELEG